MKQVNIYIYMTQKGPKKHTGAYTYILEYPVSKGPVTLSKTGTYEESTMQQAELRIMIEALKRLSKTCELTIYTELTYAAPAIEKGWLVKWQQNNWLTAKGDPVANREEWEELAVLLNKHVYKFVVKEEHTYRAWMIRETKKAEEKLCRV